MELMWILSILASVCLAFVLLKWLFYRIKYGKNWIEYMADHALGQNYAEDPWYMEDRIKDKKKK